MKAWLLHHLHVLRYTISHLRRNAFTSLLNIVVIGVALSLPAGGYILLQSLKGLSDKLAGSPQISIFLSQNATADEIARANRQLEKHNGIAAIEYIPREKGLQQLQQSTGMEDILSGLTANPLPHAFVIQPADKSAESMEALRQELEKWPRFEHVQLDASWVRKVHAILRLGQLAVLILAALLSFALIAITFNTIRLQILTRREEIEVSKLIGASNAFIRRPFLYFGLMQGMLGGLTAWLIASISTTMLNFRLADLARLYDGQFTLQLLSLGDTFTLLLFAGYLGWLGAFLSVSRHLRQFDPD